MKTSISVRGYLSRLYANRLEGEVSEQADSVARILKGQVLPSYYLVEKEPGCAKAKNLVWKQDEAAAKLFNNLAARVAGKQLVIQQTVPVINPFAFFPGLNTESPFATVTFSTQIKIRVEVYNANLPK